MHCKIPIGFSIAVSCNFIFQAVQAQSIKYSEALITYDYQTRTTDKPIPFDKSFTMIIPKLSSKDVTTIELYETTYKNGKNDIVSNWVYIKPKDLDNASRNSSMGRRIRYNTCYPADVIDASLTINLHSDTLQIFFPPLKPNRNFDINIVSKISSESRKILLKTGVQLLTHSPNELKFIGYKMVGDLFTLLQTFTSFNDDDLLKLQDYIEKDNIRSMYGAFVNSTIDKAENKMYISMDYEEFRLFYEAKLRAPCADIAATNYVTSDTFTLIDFRALETLANKEQKPFKDRHLLVEVFKHKWLKELQTGIYDINKVFDLASAADISDAAQRLKNLDANRIYFDSIVKQAEQLISVSTTTVLIGGSFLNIDTVYKHMDTVLQNIIINRQRLNRNLTEINTAIDGELSLRRGTFLAGNTVASDLKTAGANVLFLDAGLADMIVPDINNRPVHIPKLYWGVSIYFRSIDKNTRRNRFPPHFSKDRRVHHVDSKGNFGPDFGVIAHRTIWQHLCLNVGITLGAMKNKQFDNLYNNTSLLIGPAYRFARAFKVSGGVSVVNRNSKNPIISEMKPVLGGYVSLSVDIDFIQGIKDVTSILFK